MLARSAFIIVATASLGLAALSAAAPVPLTLSDRLDALASSGCTTDSVCELRAVELGINPALAGMPADALAAECMEGNDASCAYLEAGHRAQCEPDMTHADCAVFRD